MDKNLREEAALILESIAQEMRDGKIDWVLYVRGGEGLRYNSGSVIVEPTPSEKLFHAHMKLGVHLGDWVDHGE